MVFKRLKKAFSTSGENSGEEYLEIDLGQEKKEKKVLVKLFDLKDYEDVNEVLSALREGYTIAIIDTQVLRKREVIELKRAISKIKKTVDALEGSIMGFKEFVIVAPSFAKIERDQTKPKDQRLSRFD